MAKLTLSVPPCHFRLLAYLLPFPPLSPFPFHLSHPGCYGPSVAAAAEKWKTMKERKKELEHLGETKTAEQWQTHQAGRIKNKQPKQPETTKDSQHY